VLAQVPVRDDADDLAVPDDRKPTKTSLLHFQTRLNQQIVFGHGDRILGHTIGYKHVSTSDRIATKSDADPRGVGGLVRQLFFEVCTSTAEICRTTFELLHFGHLNFFLMPRSYSANEQLISKGFSHLRHRNS